MRHKIMTRNSLYYLIQIFEKAFDNNKEYVEYFSNLEFVNSILQIFNSIYLTCLHLF